ncbi:MAG: hypothetical protein AAF585_11820 [Verrucomicrobiota bacterium]
MKQLTAAIFLFSVNAFCAEPNDLAEAQSVTEIVRAICAEPHAKTQDVLFLGYFQQLPAQDFPEALRALGRYEVWQTSEHLDLLLYAWLKRDRDAAETAMRSFEPIMVPHHLTAMSWYDQIQPVDVDALSRSPIWPDKSEIGRARNHFERGEIEWDGDVDFESVRRALTNATNDLDVVLNDSLARRHMAAFVIAARRQIVATPQKAPEVLILAEQFSDSAASEVRWSWGRVEGDWAWSWFKANRPRDLGEDAGQDLFPFVSKSRREVMLRFANRWRTSTFLNWAKLDAVAAFQASLNLDGREGYSSFAEHAWYRCNIEFQSIIEAIESIETPLESINGAMILEDWGELDVGQASRWGAHWLLTTGETDRDHLLRVWTGQAEPIGESIEGRTLGCLRKWAVCEPHRMREWIEVLEADLEVKQALTWLLNNPLGKSEDP